MARFARASAPARPAHLLTSTGKAVPNLGGGQGFERTPKTELILLALSYMGKDSFYEKDQDPRLRDLMRLGAVADPLWMYDFLKWLRGSANLRTVSVIGAVEFVFARLASELPSILVQTLDVEPWGWKGVSRAVVDAVCQRPDEPSEIFACWEAYGYGPFPKPLKRGVADAVARLYTEKASIKWDSESSTFRFADIIELAHPAPRAPWQDALFGYLLDERHHSEDIATSRTVAQKAAYRTGGSLLPTLRSRYALFKLDREVREQAIRNGSAIDLLDESGMTWEALSSWLGRKLRANDWEKILPSMGLMAIVRNARNMDKAEVSDGALQPVFNQLQDADGVRQSRMLPFRFLSAYRHSSLRWHYPLDRALRLSLSSIPELSGRTLILVDRSQSMDWNVSEKTELTWSDTAALFGSALALRCASANLVQFGSWSEGVAFDKTDSPLKMVERFRGMGGTETANAVQQHFNGHDRVIILTDEEHQGGDPLEAVPAHVPVFTWNFAGYNVGHSIGGNRWTAGGVSDQAFKLIPLLERQAKDGKWPWQ